MCWVDERDRRVSQNRYQIVAAEAMEGLAQRLEERYPDRFRFHKTSWGKFPDGTDNIEVHFFLGWLPSLAAISGLPSEPDAVVGKAGTSRRAHVRATNRQRFLSNRVGARQR